MNERFVYIVVFLVLGVILISSIVSAGWFRDVFLSPTQETPVQVQVNSPPVVNYITVDGDNFDPLDFDPTQDVDLFGGGSKTVNVRFEVYDFDNNLDDTTATAQFSRSGVLRPDPTPEPCTCTLGCDPGGADTRTYECSTDYPNGIDMWYYDENAADWTVIVYIEDDFGAVVGDGSDTGTFTVNLLEDIVLLEGSPIGFPPVSSPGTDFGASLDLKIRNDGNYDAPTAAGDGDMQILAYDLYGETVITEIIPSANFDASDELVDPCTPGDGTALPDSFTTNIPDVNLPKGPDDGSSNIGYISFCLEDVPGGLSSQTFSAMTGHPAFPAQQGPWIISLE